MRVVRVSIIALGLEEEFHAVGGVVAGDVGECGDDVFLFGYLGAVACLAEIEVEKVGLGIGIEIWERAERFGCCWEARGDAVEFCWTDDRAGTGVDWRW